MVDIFYCFIYYKEIVKNYLIRKYNDVSKFELVKGESHLNHPAPYYFPFR
jgi:hypothetical protein